MPLWSGKMAQSVAELQELGLLSVRDHEAVCRVWQFGRLIANTDMHDGNLAFRPGLRLAPIYDMLPMAYAPARKYRFPSVNYQPALPAPQEQRAWLEAALAAEWFWQTATSDDSRISADFRSICEHNAQRLREREAKGRV